MALERFNRIRETTTTTGTGTYDLAGAVAGFEAFADRVTNGATVEYTVTDGADWEIGIGTFTDAAPDTIARTTIIASTNGDLAVSWAAGSKSIFLDLPASRVLNVGSAVSGGGANRILFEDGSNLLANSANLVFDGTNLGINEADPDAMLEIVTAAIGDVGLHLKGFVGQAADLFRVTDSADVDLLVIDKNGQLKIDPGGSFGDTTGIAFGDGDSVIFELADDVIVFRLGSADRVQFSTSGIQGANSGSFELLNRNATATIPNVTPDKVDDNTGMGHAGPDQLSLISGGVEGLRLAEANSVIDFEFRGAANGQVHNIKHSTTELTGLSGASVTASNLIPAGSFVVGITARTTTTITGATTWDLGDGTDVDRWGAALALGSGTTVDMTDYTASGFGQFSSANDVVLTANGANFTAGAVRLTVHYISLTAPTS